MKKLATFPIMSIYLLPMVLAQGSLPDPGILPDNPIYGLKRAFESIGDIFVFSEEAKVNRDVEIAQTRLAEIEAITQRGKPEFVDSLTRDYEERISKANEIATVVRDERREALSEVVARATARHLAILDEVKERVPDVAKDRIALAREKSIRGNEEALRALARENPEKSTEIAVDVAQRMIERVRNVAQEGDEEETVSAAEEYENYARFGEEISAIAQEVGKDPSRVQELVARARLVHLEVLQDVREKVPERARDSIQRAIDVPIARQERDIEAIRRERPGLAEEIEVRIPEGVAQREPDVVKPAVAT